MNQPSGQQAPPTPLKVAVLGAAGRMGLATIQQIQASSDLTLSCALVRRESACYGTDVGQLAGAGDLGIPAGSTLAESDVMIDFSQGQALSYWLPRCAEQAVAVVSGTTALTPAQLAVLDQAAGQVPVLWSANLSVGVAMLTRLCRQTAAALAGAADMEIVEMHHRHKKDAPSGTALALADAMNAALPEQGAVTTARQGADAARHGQEIGIAALRGGEVVGDHTVHFALAGERLELTHRAASRSVFVDGALRASRWIVSQPPGRYSLEDVLADG